MGSSLYGISLLCVTDVFLCSFIMQLTKKFQVKLIHSFNLFIYKANFFPAFEYL